MRGNGNRLDGDSRLEGAAPFYAGAPWIGQTKAASGVNLQAWIFHHRDTEITEFPIRERPVSLNQFIASSRPCFTL